MSTNLFHIGPVVGVDVQTPALEWTATPAPGGMRGMRLTGEVDWRSAKQLRELCSNEHLRRYAGNAAGVLDRFYVDHDEFREFSGWCLLEECNPSVGWEEELSGLVPITLTATHLGGHRTIRIPRSARDKGNDYGITPQALVVNPFWDDDPAGSPFLVDPGGSRSTREYDASFPHATAGTPELRRVSIYTAPFVAGADQLTNLVKLAPLPPASAPGTTPSWVTRRALDARIYDRREMRDVFGSAGEISATTDLMLVNGLCRFWVGNRGLRPFLHCQSIANGDWREPGTVQFGTTDDELVGARIERVTLDEVTVALAVQDRGEIFVTLRRGETLLRCTQPAGTPLPIWSGLPPTSRANSARVAPGHFTNALVAGSDVEDSSWAAPFSTWAGDVEHNWDGSPYQPDLRLRWPADVSPQSWHRVYRLQPLQALSALGTVGLLTIYSEGGIAEVELYVDTDAKAKVRVADTVVLMSPVLTFAAADDTVIGLGYDGTNLTLSWKAAGGAITTTTAPATITASAFYDEAFFVNFSRWGDGSWGDGVWGGVTHYPGGLIDNDMTFEDKITDAEFAALCTAAKPLANLPSVEGRLRRYVPFDAEPLVALGALSGGRRVDPVTDAYGQQKVIAAVSSDFEDIAAYLARAATGSTAADQHAQAAAQQEQQVRVR